MAKWRLYWVTDRHSDMENCFIVAKNSRSAASVHEHSEGMESGDGHAELVADIPDEYEAVAIARHLEWSREHAPEQVDRPDLHPWPWYAYEEDLLAAGAEIQEIDNNSRVVIIQGRSFMPSTMEEMLEARIRNPVSH